MIFFIVTTSLFIDSRIRTTQYINGIFKLKKILSNHLDVNQYEIIIVENNGERPTFLDSLGCKILYTNNNSLKTPNKGRKELQDIFDCIRIFNINDDDFIVKMTGRYVLTDDSEFITAVKKNVYDCIIKYGPYFKPVNYKMDDCITGLIGMRCVYVKQIELPGDTVAVEWNWAKTANTIEHVYIVNKLGIQICPDGNNYFMV
jgi:hypothetical protein